MKTKSLNGWRNSGLKRPAYLLNSGEAFQWTNVLLGLVASVLTAAGAAEPGPLQTLINQAPERSEMILPRGTWNEAIVITKPLKLRGASTETSVIEITSDEPALRITSKEAVVLESLTIRWQRATSDRTVGALAAVSMRDTCRLHVHNNVFLNNARALVLFKESGNNKNIIQTNLCWGNKIDAENFEPTPALIHDDPRFVDAANGDFTPAEPNRLKEQGLLDASVIRTLWAKWTALARSGQQ